MLRCKPVALFESGKNLSSLLAQRGRVSGLESRDCDAAHGQIDLPAGVAAISRGKETAPLAKKLGAVDYIDSQQKDPAAELKKLGGAKVVIATVTNADAMTAVLGGLAPNGVLMVIGAPLSPLSVDPVPLLFGQLSVRGWYSGASIDSQDTLRFSALAGVHSMNEIFPFDRVNEAYERMVKSDVKYRFSIDMASLKSE